MKLKPVKKKVSVEIEPIQPVKKEKKGKSKLPPAGYTPMFPPVRFLVRKTRNEKSGKITKQYLEVSVKRFDDDSARPFVWISMYQESEFYTGYLKGHTSYFPLNQLDTLIEYLQDIGSKCEEMKIQDDGWEYGDDEPDDLG